MLTKKCMKKLNVHFLGINGSGASAVAAIASSFGFKISGCADKNVRNEFTKNLDPSILYEGHSSSHLIGGEVDILAVTPAVFSADPDNLELLEAKKRGVQVLTWQQFMGKYLEKDKFIIAVCGTHGKSTTTAMVGKLLEDAGFDPTVELGAIVPSWGTNFRVGKSRYFITEADEFNDNFLASHPDICVLTTIEMDHPEFFKDFSHYKKSFYKFLSQTKEAIVANMAEEKVAELVNQLIKEKNIRVVDYSKNFLNFPFSVFGEYNRLNAQAAAQVGLILGIDGEIVKQSLSSFTGISRRSEYLGRFKKAKVYSDFGHHPTEIQVTAEAFRQKFPNQKILLIYQPHMFSRTLSLFKDFVKVFQGLPVEKTLISDIYPSREKDTGIVTSKELVDKIAKSDVSYIGSLKEIEDQLEKLSAKADIIIFMGAGDIDKLARKVVKR